MTWTNDVKLEALLRLPWRVEVRKEEGYLVAECTELPEVTGTGDNADELEADFWESMRTALKARLDEGDLVTPRGVALPWTVPFQPQRVLHGEAVGDGWEDRQPVSMAVGGVSTAVAA